MRYKIISTRRKDHDATPVPWLQSPALDRPGSSPSAFHILAFLIPAFLCRWIAERSSVHGLNLGQRGIYAVKQSKSAHRVLLFALQLTRAPCFPVLREFMIAQHRPFHLVLEPCHLLGEILQAAASGVTTAKKTRVMYHTTGVSRTVPDGARVSLGRIVVDW